MRELILRTDGACRGNPGPAGIGAVLEDTKGREVAALSEYIGASTNNVAEYRALLAGMEKALALGCRELTVYSDSQLMVRQLKGEYAVRNAGLAPLYQRAVALMAKFSSVTFKHVSREQNKRADQLATAAIEAAVGD